MPVNTKRRQARKPDISTVLFERFDGGWNIRDSISGLELNESPDMANVVIDERGGIGSRLGIEKAHANVLAGDPIQGFYWEAQNLIVIQVGAQLYKAAPGSEFTTMGAALTTSARVAMCVFEGELVFVHPVDGVFTSDGTTNTNRSTAVKGYAIAAWQNKVWVGGDSSTVWWSNIGDSHVWTTATDIISLHEADGNRPITALGVGPGMDIAGRPGLLVFKHHSMHRINDADTGSYTTLSPEVGAVGANAVTDIRGITAFLDSSGIYLTDGVNPPVYASDKIRPLFNSAILSLTDADTALWSAGVSARGTLVFNLKRVGASAPDLTLEGFSEGIRQISEHKADMPVVPHVGCAMRWLITISSATGSTLWGGGTSADYVYKVFTGGTDDGADIPAYWTSKAFEPNQYALWHLVRVRAKGRGTGVSLAVIEDWSTAAGTSFQLTNWVAEEGEWGTGTWGSPDAFGTGYWGAGSYELLHDVWNLGTTHGFALRLSATTNTASTKPPLLGANVGVPLGAWNCYGLRLDLTTLGGA